ncbi:unnamed protein product [Linum tenue]|uniref:Uncharacterized protein n=1 Tax=Linum tenue TaxID=586396 RepID=A0AAV0LCW2_9ROSI|nr:unnamed protein product [Linum tenue]
MEKEAARSATATSSSSSSASEHIIDGGFEDSSVIVNGGFDSSKVVVVGNESSSICSTPKGQRFRIPKIDSCPPAPRKKQRSNCSSLQRRPVAFFAPPDLELFFLFARRHISV